MAVAELGYKIDSSGAVVAAKNLDTMAVSAGKADGAANVLALSAKKTSTSVVDLSSAVNSAVTSMVKGQRSANVAAASFDGLGASAVIAAEEAREYQAQMDAIRAKFNPLFAASKQYEAALNEIAQAERLGAISSMEAAAARETAAKSMNATNTAALVMGKNVKVSSAHVANLGAQFNDIGVMLAAGQSPLMLAVQQGTQINQVFAQMGGGKAALRGVAAGFMSMVNPMSLATIGIIAGGAALVQWGVSAYNAGVDSENLDDKLSALADIMDIVDSSTDTLNTSTDELIQKYGLAATRVREFALAQAEIAQSQAERRLRDQVGLLDAVTDRYAAVGVAVEVAGYKMQNDLPLAMIQKDLGVTADQAEILMGAFTSLDQAATFSEQQDALSGILVTMQEQEAALSLLPPELQEAISEMITLSNEADAAKAAMDRLAGAAMGVSVGVPLFLQGFSGNELLPPEASPGGGGRRGGGSKVDEYARDLERLRESLRTEAQVVEEWKLEQDELLNNSRAIELLGIEGHNEAKIRLEEEYQDRLSSIKELGNQWGLNAALEGGDALLGAMGSFGDKALKLQAVTSAGMALMSTMQGAAKELEKGTFGFATAGLVLAKGASFIAAIKSAASGSGSTATASSAGVSAAPAEVAQPQQTRAIVALQSGRSRFTIEEMNDIAKQLQGLSKDGVIIEGFTRA